MVSDSTKFDPDALALVGMGYVGVSVATVLAESGFRVFGIDVDQARVDRIEDGECPIDEDVISESFETSVGEGRISATTDFDVLEGCKTVIVTVGTPLSGADPDLSAVEAATEQLGSHVQSGQLLIYRSTMPPGTTADVVKPILERESGLAAGEAFDLAYCPERMAEGSAYDDLTTLPVVVGGVTEQSGRRAECFWQDAGVETVSVSDATAAELTKLADNWWIDLNIALANELALLSEQLGVNALEVIHAANTLPKGEHNVNILFPGAGVGGSCLVKDPWFVAHLGDEHGLELETPRVSRRINDRMPAHVVDLVTEQTGGVDGLELAVLGYAFKGGTDDARNTPAREVIDELRERGASVRVTDPFVPAETVETEVGIRPTRLPEALGGADGVVVLTGHDQYQSLSVPELREYVGRDSFTVTDGRHVFDPAAFIDTHIDYRAVGIGHDT